ncbi:MAG: lysophospholipid acyltransferase family protein [Pseudomonadota bacterium]
MFSDLSFLEQAKLRAEALALRCLWRLSLMLGPERASNLAARLMGWLVGPGRDVIRRIRRNLSIALKDQEQPSIDQLTEEAASNLGRVVVEYPHLRRIAGHELPRFIDFVAETPEAAVTPERPSALYIGVHQANWEILSALAFPLGKPMTIVVSPLSNPFVHQLVSKARPDVWVEQAERDQATRSLVRCLQSGRSVGLLADQRYEGGQLVPFFGQDAMTAIGPAKLAIKFGCDLVPTRIERIGAVRFRITTFAAIRPDQAIIGDQKQAVDMMRRVNQHFEAWIREKPGEWMCMKRRWPKSVYRDVTRPLPPSSNGSPEPVSGAAAT